MANKKMILSVATGAMLASALFGAEETDAASHKVKSGESLWSISQKYGTTVNALKSINNLTSNTIYSNQVIETTKTAKKPARTIASKSATPVTASSTTYTVKSGDTLSKIASTYGMSLSKLMKLNNLDTTLIFPGNELKVSGSVSSATKTVPAKKSVQPSKSSTAAVYTVKSGDTLSKVAKEYGVTVASLKANNSLSADTIYVGQKLSINGKKTAAAPKTETAAATVNADAGYDVNKLVSAAKKQQGTPYQWGGSAPGGFDCSGFIQYAFEQAGKDLTRTSSAGYFDRSYYVNSPQPGDLVFFSGTYKSGISHMGIYIGDNQFIHAGSSNGVQVTSLDNSYWSKHFDSFKRFY